MVKVIFTEKFKKELKKSDNSIREKVKKQIKKITENPLCGKPLRYNLKNERTIYIKPYRIIFTFDKDNLYFLRFEHRKSVYVQN